MTAVKDRTYYSIVASPIGELMLVGDGEHLTGLYMDLRERWPVRRDDWRREESPFDSAREQLRAYLAGELRVFDLPLMMKGSTFQQRVWSGLREIPYGMTISYGELARRLGNPNASRAVGLANGSNPISIVVPCHRVIGASGSLTGYGGGLQRKQWLLRHEGALLL